MMKLTNENLWYWEDVNHRTYWENKMHIESIKSNSKEAEKLWNKYCNATCEDIYDAYGRPSAKKVEAFKRCYEIMVHFDGRGMRVIGAGSSYFSCGFRYEEDDKHMILYFLPTRTVKFEIPKEV